MPGKIKTVAQMIGILALLIVPDLAAINDVATTVVFYVGFVALAFGMLMAVISCVLYLCKYPSVFSESEK